MNVKTVLIDPSAGTLRPIIRLAWPVMTEELLNLLVGYTDWWLTGRFLKGDEYQAAMALMVYILWLIPSLFSAVAIGATALIARSMGAGDQRQAQRVAHQALLSGLVLSLFITAGMALGGPLLLRLLRLPAAAQPAALQYLLIIVPAIPAIMVEQVAIAVLRGAGDTVTGLLAKCVVNVVNAVVSAGLVVGWWIFPELGWRGLAWGTALGHVTACLLLLVALTGGFSQIRWRWQELRPDRGLLVRMWRVGLPGGMDMLAVLACHLGYVSIINTLGTAAAAAHGLGVQLEALAYAPASSFSVAAATLTGQYLGAGDAGRASRAIRQAILLAGTFMTSMGVAFACYGWLLVGWFVGADAQETTALATSYMRIVAWSMPCLAVTRILSGALRGAGDTRWTLIITFVGLALIRIPGAAWLSWDELTIPLLDWHVGGWSMGVRGAWWAMVIDVSIRCVLLSLRFAQGGWKRLQV
ncbi:MAG: MATE family efflux transporter [Planctomycetota bacterium]